MKSPLTHIYTRARRARISRSVKHTNTYADTITIAIC